MLLLLVASQLLAMFRGFEDAGGLSFGWYQGYRESMNSLRLGKALPASLLLFPLWMRACKRDAQRSSDLLSKGLLLGLLGASLAAAWERLAFTDLLNFSADYRTTALFWEMHVGGAAFDGFLALTMPFAVHGMLLARSKGAWAFATCACAAGAYACLTTFSRGVYLAVPIGLAATLGLHTLQMRRATAARQGQGRQATAQRVVLVWRSSRRRCGCSPPAATGACWRS